MYNLFRRIRGVCFLYKISLRELVWRLIKATFQKLWKKALSSRLLRASVVAITFCCIAIWLSDDSPMTLRDLALILFSSAEPIAIATAAVVFILDSSDRKKTEQYEAWQVINSASGQTGSGGRIQALKELNEAGLDLEGVAAPGADLSGINLSYGKLSRANLERAQMDRANLRGAKLIAANLRDADLSRANLRSAELGGADLSGANLRGADLSFANLSFAVQRGALDGVEIVFALMIDQSMEASISSRSADEGEPGTPGRTDLSRANLESANLTSANLSAAKGITKEQLKSAVLCNTRLPAWIKLDSNRDCKKSG